MISLVTTRDEMLRMQLEEVNHAGNIHIAQYKPEFVFDLLAENSDKDRMRVGDYWVGTGSDRYKLFQQSCRCVSCGTDGTVMCLDVKGSLSRRAHFNLYGITYSGRCVMLTKDHIVPKAKGGGNEMSNYQTMCETCNHQKGSS